MKSGKRWIAVILAALLLSAAAGKVAADDGAVVGLFGHVSAVQPLGEDHVLVTVDTKEGPKEVEITPETQLRVPGVEAASAGDLAVDQFLALMAQDVAGRLLATRVLVKPARPLSYQHVVGVVTDRENHRITLVDAQGASFIVDLPVGLDNLAQGEMVTAIVKRDPSTRRLMAQDARSAGETIHRLKQALEAARAEKRQRLAKHLKTLIGVGTARHLSALAKAVERVPPQAQAVLQRVLAAAQQRYQQTHQVLELPPPTIEVSGLVYPYSQTRTIIVAPPPGKGTPIELAITDATEITFEGRDVAFEDLALGYWVKALYDISSYEATAVEVVRRELKGNLLGPLLERVQQGEVEGKVIEKDILSTPPTVVIALASGERLSLTVSPETRILVFDQVVTLDTLPPGSSVKVRYDPETGEAVEITRVALLPGERHVSGVVSWLVRKGVTPVVTIVSRDGESKTFRLAEEVLIWRNGLRVTIADVQKGDLVRPTSLYNPGTGEIRILVLLSEPVPIEGVVVGKVTSPEGDDLLTVSTPRARLVTLHVPTIASLERDGNPVTFADIRIGDRVTRGSYKLVPAYDDLVMEAIGLVLESASAARIEGTVTAIDASSGTFTVQPVKGPAVTLSIFEKTEVEKNGAKGITAAGLALGDTVVSAVYRPDTGEVLRVVVLSPDVQALRGIVQSVDTSSSQVTVKSGGRQVVLTVTPLTTLVKNGKAASLSDLTEEDRVVTAFYNADMVATRLIVVTPNVIRVKAQGLARSLLSR